MRIYCRKWDEKRKSFLVILSFLNHLTLTSLFMRMILLQSTSTFYGRDLRESSRREIIMYSTFLLLNSSPILFLLLFFFFFTSLHMTKDSDKRDPLNMKNTGKKCNVTILRTFSSLYHVMLMSFTCTKCMLKVLILKPTPTFTFSNYYFFLSLYV